MILLLLFFAIFLEEGGCFQTQMMHIVKKASTNLC